MEDAFVEVLGARAHYVHAGVGRPLVLIHGLTGSAGNWRRNIPALSRDASVYAIDLMNTGKSDRLRGLDAGLEATADRVAEMMDALGLAGADIAGHSHGGAVALMLAARHPAHVCSLMLFAPANPYCDLGDLLVRFYSTPLGGYVAKTAPYLPREVQLLLLERMYGDPARIVEGSLEGYIEGIRLPGSVDHLLAIVQTWFADMKKLEAALPRIAGVPAMLVWGDCDRAVSVASAKRLQRELPGSELAVVRGAGHVVFEEMPDEANRLMLDWLRRGTVSQPEVVARSTAARQRREPSRSASVVAKRRAGAGPRLAPEAQGRGD